MGRPGKYHRIFGWLATGTIIASMLVAFLTVTAQAQDEGDIILGPVEGRLDDKVEVSGAGFDAGTYLYLYFSADKADLNDAIDGKVTRYKLLERNIRTTEETDVLPGEFDTYFMVPDILDDGEDPGGRYSRF